MIRPGCGAGSRGSLPFDLRWRAAFDHALAGRLAGLLQAAIARRDRRIAREAGLTDPQGGAVLVMQCFASDLRSNLPCSPSGRTC